jgi:hypothetical protein
MARMARVVGPRCPHHLMETPRELSSIRELVDHWVASTSLNNRLLLQRYLPQEDREEREIASIEIGILSPELPRKFWHLRLRYEC